MITVSVHANTTALTTLDRAKRFLGVEVTSNDQLIEDLIRTATAAVESHCHRTFARESLVETVKGFGGTTLMLGRAPIATVASVLADGTDPITDYVRESDGAGLLYRKRGWNDTVQLGWAITDYRVPGSEDPSYQVTYSAGYLLPGDDVEAEGEFFSAIAASRQFVATDEVRFPLTLVGGDRVFVRGFANAANGGANGAWFTVQSVAAQALTVAEALVDEAPAEGTKLFQVSTLPADVEQATWDTLKNFYLRRKTDDDVQSKSVGDLSITYRQPGYYQEALPSGVPLGAVGRLAPYVRMA